MGRKPKHKLLPRKRRPNSRCRRELQRRADQALLNTYISVEEIVMHRDRRVELFRAQARVTELYLRNLARRLDRLKTEAGRYKPYSSDPNAAMIDPSLVAEISDTEGAIQRHEDNLKQFRSEEKQIRDRFEGDIERFKRLKGIDSEESGLVSEQQAGVKQPRSDRPRVTETTVASIAVGKLLDHLKTHLLDRHKNHLCNSLGRLDFVTPGARGSSTI